MDVHAHGGTPDSYLSGNMHFDDHQTKTFYRSSFDPFNSKIDYPQRWLCNLSKLYNNTTEEHSGPKPYKCSI